MVDALTTIAWVLTLWILVGILVAGIWAAIGRGLRRGG